MPAYPIDVSGERMLLRGDRTLFWPKRGWLIVADLHLGKATSLRREGVAIPDRVMDDDLARLAGAVQDTRTSLVVVLGDLIHDGQGLTGRVVRQVAEWRERIGVAMALIPGNHDRRVESLPPEWQVEQWEPRVSEGPFTFSHDLVPRAKGFTWHGHVHPVLVLQGRGDRLRLPCFVVRPSAGVLPAFTALAGGGAQELSPGDAAWVVADGSVWPVPHR